MKYAIVEELAGKHGVQHACEMLGVSTSGYYEWRRRRPSQRDIDDARLLEEIREVHMLSGGRFGARKVWHRLKDRGVACGLRKVTRLMRQEGLKSRCFRARRSITVADESAPPVPNVLNREFVAEKPNEKWVSDITQCRTRTGWIYLAVVLDLCSRKVVGWAVSQQADRALVIAAFQRAADERSITPGLLVHTDRGSQYTSHDFVDMLDAWECIRSMSRKGECYDNAVAESFFRIFKAECLPSSGIFDSFEEARLAIFEWIEGFYNRNRPHSALNYSTPEQFEQRMNRF